MAGVRGCLEGGQGVRGWNSGAATGIQIGIKGRARVIPLPAVLTGLAVGPGELQSIPRTLPPPPPPLATKNVCVLVAQRPRKRWLPVTKQRVARGWKSVRRFGKPPSPPPPHAAPSRARLSTTRRARWILWKRVKIPFSQPRPLWQKQRRNFSTVGGWGGKAKIPSVGAFCLWMSRV